MIPVKNDLHMDYANELRSKLVAHNIRVEIDDRNERWVTRSGRPRLIRYRTPLF